MANGIKYLHDSKPIIAHLDIKSPNIFLMSHDPSEKLVAKIGDFGLARYDHGYFGEGEWLRSVEGGG